jgi:hypothetical protein
MDTWLKKNRQNKEKKKTSMYEKSKREDDVNDDQKCHILNEPYNLTVVPDLDKDKKEQNDLSTQNAN